MPYLSLTLSFFLLLSTSPTISACIFCSQPAHPHPIHHHPTTKPPTTIPPPASGGGIPAITTPPAVKCSLDILKLGLCLNVLGGLVQVGLAPVEIYCCPVIEGLLESEAAACLCAAIDLKVLNLNIYIPLALQVLIACGKDPPPGYFCPLLY
ncbi:36.4 kDa proline-rich protein-like [Dendrobium catenatum]|uniref:36.4 kDa proline-rich protein n=1 Tax=Dendrobium catenatum TaxID=906689 RepID=A0A2I0WNB6_9ASPA|nr:36.4 kDa proline-rich protein-like [Dendrobium catenatum]PKU77159.1 36.4 kDa proline-rich protein [Dendrobium catenatum]